MAASPVNLRRSSVMVAVFVLSGTPTVFTQKLAAAEIDSFTHRHALHDSRRILNRVVNVWLEEALITANKPTLLPDTSGATTERCDQNRLFDALKARFAGFLIGQVESFANESTDIDSIRVSFDDSIYRDFDVEESPTVALTGRLAVLVRVTDVYVGSDKFGHFFTEGHTYFEKYSSGNPFSALEYGELTERLFYGAATTGVYSYADLTANLNGLRFWNSVLALQPDPMSPAAEIEPYVGCVNKKWQLLREFDWVEYVDPIWDEALNCSVFKDRGLLHKAKARIAAATDGRSCPLKPVDTQRLEVKYGELLKYLYNPEGNRVLVESTRPDFERYWSTLFDRIQ